VNPTHTEVSPLLLSSDTEPEVLLDHRLKRSSTDSGSAGVDHLALLGVKMSLDARRSDPATYALYAVQDDEDLDTIDEDSDKENPFYSQQGHQSRQDQQVLLHPDFDISISHLYKLFTVLDTNGDGELTYQQLKEGFESMDAFPNLSDEELDKVIRNIDQDCSQTITLNEFVVALQEHAAKSFMANGASFDLFCYDYSPRMQKRVVITAEETGELGCMSLDNFLRHHIQLCAGARVRWLSYVGDNPTVFIRIANAYALHPLAISDVLESKQRSKVEVYGCGNIQILLGKIARKERPPDRVRLEQISIFMVKGNTVITVEKTPSSSRSELMARIKYTGSKVRLNDARYLVHALVDSSVDSVMPFMRGYQHELNILYKSVHCKNQQFTLAHVKDIQRIYRQVIHMSNWLRPVRPVIEQLQESLAQGDKDFQRHFTDLIDNVETLREHAKSMEKQAKSLNEDYINQQQYRMNAVMYVLTVVTTIFIPGQFLAGVYGMNFTYMPELGFRWSYPIFWMVVLSGAVATLFAFYRNHWLDVKWF